MRKPYCKGKLLCAIGEYLLSYRRGALLLSKKETPNWIIKETKIGGFLSKFELSSRLLRLEPRCAAPIDDSRIIISHNGRILIYNIHTNEIFVDHEYERGMKNPLFFCVTEGQAENTIYYGEYIHNTEHGPVAVYKREKEKWEKVYEFPANTVTHIHGIIHDKYRNQFIILTGDSDSESGIWLADQSFNSVTPILKGNQQYRACVAFPRPDGLVYATDTPLEANALYYVKYDIADDNKIKKLCEIPGSCIYGTNVNGKDYISTTVEPDSSLAGWKYRLTYRLGKGIKDRFSYIFQITDDGVIHEKVRVKKDWLPIWLFQFGNFLFPYNDGNDVYYTTQSLKDGHGKTFKLD